MGITVFLQHLVSWFPCKSFHGSNSRLWKYGIFICSPLRCFSVINNQRDPISFCLLVRFLSTRILWKVLLEFSCYGSVIACPDRVHPILPIFFIILPEVAVGIVPYGKLENGGFRRILTVCILDIRTEAYDCSVEEME